MWLSAKLSICTGPSTLKNLKLASTASKVVAAPVPTSTSAKLSPHRATVYPWDHPSIMQNLPMMSKTELTVHKMPVSVVDSDLEVDLEAACLAEALGSLQASTRSITTSILSTIRSKSDSATSSRWTHRGEVTNSIH